MGPEMTHSEEFDLSYVTNDSITEGVGSSQIIPLVKNLVRSGLRVSLVSFEKNVPKKSTSEDLSKLGINWIPLPFGKNGNLGGVQRIEKLKSAIPNTKLIHGRSDIATVAGIFAHKAPVLWDVRSLWADQKILNRDTVAKKFLYQSYRKLESISNFGSSGISTLTSAVIPILQTRHKKLPELQIVVPTAVDLERFQLTKSLPKQVKVLFSGTYSDYYDLELSAKFLKEIDKKVRIEIHWARPAEAITRVLNVGEVKSFFVEQEQMSEVIGEYSFGVAVCKMSSGPSLTAAMPTKIAEFLASGRPVVVNKGLGDMDQLLQDSGAGVFLDGSRGNLSEAADQLLNLLADPKTPFNCRELAEKHFSLAKGTNKYLEIYTKIISLSN